MEGVKARSYKPLCCQIIFAPPTRTVVASHLNLLQYIYILAFPFLLHIANKHNKIQGTSTTPSPCPRNKRLPNYHACSTPHVAANTTQNILGLGRKFLFPCSYLTPGHYHPLLPSLTRPPWTRKASRAPHRQPLSQHPYIPPRGMASPSSERSPQS